MNFLLQKVRKMAPRIAFWGFLILVHGIEAHLRRQSWDLFPKKDLLEKLGSTAMHKTKGHELITTVAFEQLKTDHVGVEYERHKWEEGLRWNDMPLHAGEVKAASGLGFALAFKTGQQATAAVHFGCWQQIHGMAPVPSKVYTPTPAVPRTASFFQTHTISHTWETPM